MTQPKTLPDAWPFSVSVEDQRGAAITGESTGLIDNVTMLRNPRRRPSPKRSKRALADIADAPY
jgi:hypothetical protein